MKLRALAVTAAILAVSFLSGCTPPYRQTFEDAAKEKHWTHKQMLAAFAYADRIWWARELKEGSNTYVILYGKVPTSKVAAQTLSVLNNLDALLNPNDPGARQYLDTFNLRKDLEHEEQIGEAQYAREHAADLQDQFSKLNGDTPSYGPEATVSSGYNIKKIFLAKDPAEAFPFKSDEIEGAKKDGSLKEIESLQLDFQSPYDHKAPNPAIPDDSNEFIWKPVHMAIQLTNYKIITDDKPQDNKGNYIEGYRVIDGKKESKPALKIFFPSNGYGAIVLIDTDREGDAGFGVPDILQSVSGLDNVRDVIANGTLLATLFQEKKSEKRVLPPHNLFKIEISTVDKPIDPWEKAPTAEGWIVPYKYADKTGENYTIEIKFKKLRHEDLKDSDGEMDMSKMQYREIEYIAKVYHKSGDKYSPSAGQVVEYFRPRDGAAKKCKAEVDYGNDQKINFTYEDGTEMSAVLTPKSKLVEDVPYAKSFVQGQNQFRWWVESSNGDGKYDKRKKVSLADRQSSDDVSEAEGAAHPSNGWDSMAPPCAQTNTCKPVEQPKQ